MCVDLCAADDTEQVLTIATSKALKVTHAADRLMSLAEQSVITV